MSHTDARRRAKEVIHRMIIDDEYDPVSMDDLMVDMAEFDVLASYERQLDHSEEHCY